ncbi:3-phenylpropionate/trans-cinnamate dioxygenase ferredoxin reductase subunit [Asanoa ferruginea]|uniref:3-phenylpropionate/trans-cinnamate dioxygenase ferredoxin reductase subunit n=1 Tax=Asanoa ferruginea TaxID=53367 RepID=A0A3D9ZCM8_9ACTN|nr:FAD/NAD(P)-binding oxidoreductase [Asanoa ferruginea]REF94212.1 3-phenylpropionate/trans-cinnamate dioxygenase ferredoxin reductase subunit [Asanoa ferruginea]GIF49840.1 ferredoxin [Asanoa ferruginea]
MSDQFVIVGASLAGARAASTLREEGFDGGIVLVGAEDDLPYERPPLSKGYLLGKKERQKAFVHDAAFYEQQRIELRLGTRATAIDPAGHQVTLDSGESLPYRKLLLATGSSPRTLELPGGEARRIHYLRTIEQSEALGATLRAGDPVVVIGAGWIGLEIAAAARHYGCDVTVVETDRAPLRQVLGDEVGAVFRALHEAHGVEFHFDTQVRAFGALGDRLTHAVLDDNVEVPASAAVIAVGISPNVELARSAGLRVDDGVVTDAALRTSDPDIHACGDVASSYHPLAHEHIRVEHWANALNGGPAAARSMLGHDVSYDRLPYFFTDQYDLGMEMAGWFPRGGYDRVVFRGDPSIVDGKAPEFVAFWTRRGHVLAGMNVNVWDVQDDIQKLVRAGYTGKDVDLDRLADPSVPLDTLLDG